MAVGGDLERLVVTAVLLSGLSHQADVGHRAHGRRIEGAVGPAVVDDDLIDAGVARIRQHGQGVGLAPVRTPHVPRGPDHRRHRGIHDDVARDVEVGDALVGVDHRQGRTRRQLGGERLGDRRPFGEASEAIEDRAQAVVRAQTCRGEDVAIGGECDREEGPNHMAEDDRIRDLHHGRLEVDAEEHALSLGGLDLGGQEGIESIGAHHGGIDDLLVEHRHGCSKRRRVAGFIDQVDRDRAGPIDDDRLLRRGEVICRHVRHVGLRGGLPRSHAVRVRLGVVLHRRRCPAIRVSLAQNRVDGAAQDLLEAGEGLELLGARRIVRIVRDRRPLGLELGDGSLELRDRGGHVRELDDVGLGFLDHGPELAQGIVDALLGGQRLGKGGQDATGEGDVTRLDGDASLGGIRPDDGQQGVGGEGGCLVGVGVDDRGVTHRC